MCNYLLIAYLQKVALVQTSFDRIFNQENHWRMCRKEPFVLVPSGFVNLAKTFSHSARGLSQKQVYFGSNYRWKRNRYNTIIL